MKRFLVLVVLVLAERGAAADEFWVHAEAGPGWVSLRDRYATYTATASGMSLGLAVGGHVKPRAIVYAALGGTFTSAPTFEWDSGNTFMTGSDDSLASTSIGVGVLYVPKRGLYVGGGLTSQHVTLDTSELGLIEHGLGVGISVRAGKEWKVGKHVTIGGTIRIEGAGKETSTFSQSVTDLALLFSGSYQ